MIAALKKAGGKPRYTEYPGVDHGSWGPALQEAYLPTWLFAQARSNTVAIAVPASGISGGSARHAAEGNRARRLILRGSASAPSSGDVDGLGRAATPSGSALIR